MKTHVILAFSILMLGMVGCTTVSETGRRQLLITSPAEESQQGLAAFADIKKTEKISTDAKANAQVQRVGNRIKDSVIKSHAMPDAQWEFVVFDSNDVNAFALPGGKVGVYTGLLKLVASDDELAIVVGHEIAHVTSRHGGERASQNTLANTVGQLGQAAIGATQYSDTTKNLILTAYGVGSQGALLGYSRTHETEADTIGMKFAAEAGYNPQAAAAFWRKMAAAGGSSAKDPGLMARIQNLTSTHPLDADRIANLEKLAPKYQAAYEQAKLQYK